MRYIHDTEGSELYRDVFLLDKSENFSMPIQSHYKIIDDFKKYFNNKMSPDIALNMIYYEEHASWVNNKEKREIMYLAYRRSTVFTFEGFPEILKK